jgi:hypothetical protein
MTTPKFEIALPIWPEESGFRYFGADDHIYRSDTCGSFWLSLRAVMKEDQSSYSHDATRHIQDLGLYCWFSNEDKISIELRINARGGSTLYEAEQTIKALKRLIRKAKDYPLGTFVKGTGIHTELTRVLAALDIKNSVQYRGAGRGETYEPIGIAVNKIATIVNLKLIAMTQRAAA